MFKPSVTVHKSPAGDLKVLECSEDASKVLEAYKSCKEPGEIVYIRKGYKDKFKKIEAIREVVAETQKVVKKAAKKAVKKAE